MKLRLIALLALPLVAATPANAQTAEEAVAYAFFGLADGAKLIRGSTTMLWKESSGSPATYDADATIRGQTASLRFIVKALSDCAYEVTLEGPPKLVPGSSRLFAKVALDRISGVTVEAPAVTSSIAGTGFCTTGPANRTCMVVNTTELFGPIDMARHKETVAFLTGEVCKATTQ